MTRKLRIPILLNSYLVTEMLAPFFASFLIMNSVFFLVKLVPLLNIVLELGIGLQDFIRLFAYIFPNIFLYSLPMSAMMGVIIGFTRLTSDTEILALKSCGTSLYQTVPSVFVVSTIIALLTGYFSINLIPASEIAMKQLMFRLAKEKIDHGIQEQQFTEALGDLVVYVESADDKTKELKNVWVSDMRGQEIPIITMATTGKMTSDVKNMMVTIILYNGSLHQSGIEDAQIVDFDRYRINIPLQPPSLIDGKNVNTLSSKMMTMAQLQKRASELGRDTKSGRKMLIHYEKRLVLPVGCLILSLLGLPFGLLGGPGKRAIGVPVGLFFFMLYYVMFSLSQAAAENGVMPVEIVMWIPNGIFLVMTLYCLHKMTHEQPLVPDFVTNRITLINNRFLFPLFKKLHLLAGHSKTKVKTVKPIIRKVAPKFLQAGIIRANAYSRVYHFPECEFYTCKYCTMAFKNTKIAAQAGFQPCKFCKSLKEKYESEELDKAE